MRASTSPASSASSTCKGASPTATRSSTISTAVSAAHNALDHYGLYYVPEYLRLAELTGKELWRQRARALWYNGIQLISDGTMVVSGRVRPAGAQDESFRHTRWGRTDHKLFVPCEWCTVWQGTFRHVVLEELENWDILR